MAFTTTTLATIGAVASIAGTAISAVGAYQQGEAAKAKYAYDAQVASNNAIIAEQNAQAIEARGKVEEQDHRRKIAQTQGAARASMAANGFLIDDTGDSTNVLLQGDIAEAGELDVLRIRDNTMKEARQQRIMGVNYQASAAGSRFSGSQITPLLNAGATLLEGAGRAAGMYATRGMGRSTNSFMSAT